MAGHRQRTARPARTGSVRYRSGPSGAGHGESGYWRWTDESPHPRTAADPGATSPRRTTARPRTPWVGAGSSSPRPGGAAADVMHDMPDDRRGLAAHGLCSLLDSHSRALVATCHLAVHSYNFSMSYLNKIGRATARRLVGGQLTWALHPLGTSQTPAGGRLWTPGAVTGRGDPSVPKANPPAGASR